MGSKTASLSFLRTLPLLWLSVTFLAGIVLASAITVNEWVWNLVAVFVAAVTFGLRRLLSWEQSFGAAAAIILLIGAARYQVAQPNFDSDDLATYNDSEDWVEVTGILEKPAAPRDGYVELIVRAEQIRFPNGDELSVHGVILARTELGAEWNYGDRIRVSGELTTPIEYEDFSYRDYLARQNIFSVMRFAAAERLETSHGNPFWSALYWLRQRGVETVYKIYSAREASLLAGILLGDESGLSESLKTAFNHTGTRHIIAISGFNISIIAGIFLALFGKLLGRRRGIWAAGIGIALYTILVGADASVVRAAIMGILALVALQTGRQSYALNALGFSAALMAFVNPLVLWDVGFQLSFAATLGLILFAEPMRVRVDGWLTMHLHSDWAKRLSRPINDYLLLTIAAQITTLPILLIYFQRLSLLSLPANILILPAQPALMILGGLSMLAGMIILPLGKLIGIAGWALAAYTIRIVELFAGFVWAAKTFDEFPIYFVFAYFILVTAVSFPAIRQRLGTIRFQPAIVVIVLGTITLWSWSIALAAPDGNLRLTLLDAPGEALLVQTPEGRHLLINTGTSRNDLLSSVSGAIPFGQELDWMIVAGRRSDQIGGLSALDRLQIRNIGIAIEGTLDEIVTQIKGAETEMMQLHAGDYLDLGNGAKLEIVSEGTRGALLLLHWQNFKALLPLGLDFDQMEQLSNGATLGPVDVLLLADSGYPPLNPPDWIANLSPAVTCIASDENTAFEMDTFTYQTATNGWIQAVTDGQQMWLEVERR